MTGAFWWDLLASFLGGVGAGGLILLVADRTLEIRKESRRRKDQRRKRVERAVAYLDLIEEEIDLVVKAIPGQRAEASSRAWGKDVPLLTPVWDVVQQTGELVGLLHPDLVRDTARFFAVYGYAERLLDWLKKSWLAPEVAVDAMELKRTECITAMKEALDEAEREGKKVLPSFDEERTRLSGQTT